MADSSTLVLMAMLDDDLSLIEDVAGLFDTTALKRYPYDGAVLTGRRMTLLRAEGLDGQWEMEKHPLVEAWRLRLHAQLGRRYIDNKETFQITPWQHLHYVQFWDGAVWVSTSASPHA